MTFAQHIEALMPLPSLYQYICFGLSFHSYPVCLATLLALLCPSLLLSDCTYFIALLSAWPRHSFACAYLFVCAHFPCPFVQHYPLLWPRPSLCPIIIAFSPWQPGITTSQSLPPKYWDIQAGISPRSFNRVGEDSSMNPL